MNATIMVGLFLCVLTSWPFILRCGGLVWSLVLTETQLWNKSPLTRQWLDQPPFCCNTSWESDRYKNTTTNLQFDGLCFLPPNLYTISGKSQANT